MHRSPRIVGDVGGTVFELWADCLVRVSALRPLSTFRINT